MRGPPKERSISGAPRTADGEEITVRANIELAGEVADVHEYGADGVGLFRTEFLYLAAGDSSIRKRLADGGLSRRGVVGSRRGPS